MRYDGIYRIARCWRTKGKQVRAVLSPFLLAFRLLWAALHSTHIAHCLPFPHAATCRLVDVSPLNSASPATPPLHPSGLPHVPLPVCAVRQRARSLELRG